MNKLFTKLLGVFILLVVYAFTKLPTLSSDEQNKLAANFAFEKTALFYDKNTVLRTVRDVHPQYKHFETWISSVGAAASVCDYDNDGKYNDVIYIDARNDEVYISPADNDFKRFQPFKVSVNSLPFNKDTMVPSGILVNDFNEDGKTDFIVTYLGRSPIIFYQKSHDTYIESELDNTGLIHNTTTATLADVNGDGHSDVIICNYFPDGFMIYDKNSKDRNHKMHNSMSRGNNGAINRLFVWNGSKNGRALFVEDKEWLKNISNNEDWTLAVAACDLNNDLLPELYVSNDFGPDKLLLNTTKNGKISFQELKGKRKFGTVRSAVLGKDSFKGMGADFADFNNDGYFDIFVSNIADSFALNESHFLFINTKAKDFSKTLIAPFENKSEKYLLSRSSWGWDSKLADFNNDGVYEAVQATGFIKGKVNKWPELQELATQNDELLSNPKFWPQLKDGDDLSGDSHIPFFVRHSDGKYYDLAPALGIGENQVTRGIAIGDFNQDGLQDFISSGQFFNSNVYTNKSRVKNSYVNLNIGYINKDSKIRRPAIGARAELIVDGHKRIGFVDGGNGHSGRNSNEVHFGLGNKKPTNIVAKIYWKDRSQKTIVSTFNIQPGHHNINLLF